MNKDAPITILVDSREQKPFLFANSERVCLATGDYSIHVGDRDYRDQISVERKSLSDLLGCIGGSRERFERELERLAKIEYRALVVETGLSDLLTPGRSEIHPNAVLGSLCAWSMKYRLPIWFCGDRRIGQAVTERLLLKAAKYADGEIINE